MSDTSDATETDAQESNTSAGPFTSSDPVELPADHPLVKALAAQKAEIKGLKAKASRLDEIENEGKSEIQRATDAAAEAVRERDAALADALRLRVAAKHGISDEDADLFLTGADEESMTRQAKRLVGMASERKAGGNVVPRAGGTPATQGGSTTADLFAAAVESQFTH